MTTLINPLNELIPARYRKYLYSLAALAALIFSVWQASEGEWKTFAAGLFATLVPLLAASNTPASPAEIDEAVEAELEDEYPFDGHSEV